MGDQHIGVQRNLVPKLVFSITLVLEGPVAAFGGVWAAEDIEIGTRAVGALQLYGASFVLEVGYGWRRPQEGDALCRVLRLLIMEVSAVLGVEWFV